MGKRIPISKRLRFEVFKRDHFRCQYCGADAHSTLLHVDHIKPVAEGGDNNILNLVTACRDCNLGKGKRLLCESDELSASKNEIQALAEKREQLEMLREWRDELAQVENEAVDFICEEIERLGVFSPSEAGRSKIRTWIGRYDLDVLIIAVRHSFHRYMKWDGDEPVDSGWEKAFNNVQKIANTYLRYGEKALSDRLPYIQGILRNRFGGWGFYIRDLVILMDKYGVDFDVLEECARQADDWDQFVNLVDAYAHQVGSAEARIGVAV